MAEATEDLQDHRNNLKPLCRVKKSKEKYECSYSCIEHKELLAEKYQLNIEKDHCVIHPSHFCNACYVSLTRTSAERGPIFWEIHTDSCKTCFAITEKQSKGGRPRKPKRGRKPTSDKLKSPASHDSSVLEGLQSKIQDITQTLEKHRTRDFDEKFTLTETLNTDFNCPICKDIVDRPLETACEHYFCASCFENEPSTEACPMYKFPLSAPQVKPTTRMILRLIGEIKVGCKRCKTQLTMFVLLRPTCSHPKLKLHNGLYPHLPLLALFLVRKSNLQLQTQLPCKMRLRNIEQCLSSPN